MNERPDRKSEALNKSEDEFARQAGRRLRQSADELDAATLSRLNRARQSALDEMPRARGNGFGWWVPAGVTALVAMIAIGVWQAGGPIEGSPEIVPLTADEVADFDMLLDDGDLEMLEDLEFFAWLSETDMETAG
ncbi:MAG: DUF3619 family protein [Gammaproteobacteria bacterium]|nr:DUF3619 family protein [Gammaproteobacteria bacterium]MBT8444897.1 DUF3619 family protein [Gammaproteobacteria bacterium]